MLPVFGIGSSGNGFLVRGAAVQVDELLVHLNVRLPMTVCFTPNSLDASAVVVVEGAGGNSEVVDAVVGSDSIYMIDGGRGLNPVVEEVREPMGKVLPTPEGDVPVSILGDGASYRADNRVSVNLLSPAKVAGIWFVFKVLTNFLWDNLVSHFKSPLDLVRGVGTAIPTLRLYGLRNKMLARVADLMTADTLYGFDDYRPESGVVMYVAG